MLMTIFIILLVIYFSELIFQLIQFFFGLFMTMFMIILNAILFVLRPFTVFIYLGGVVGIVMFVQYVVKSIMF